MIKIKIADVAKKNGLKSAYALQKALDVSPTIASRLWKGEFQKIGVNTLDKLCEQFKCQPSAFFEFWKDGVMQLGKPITQLSKEVQPIDTQLDKTGEKWLSTKEIADRIERKPRTVIDLFKSGKLTRKKRGQENFGLGSEVEAYIAERDAENG